MTTSTTGAAPARTAVEPAPPTAVRTAVERMRLTLISLGLTLAVFAQSAGNTATDTKFDLVISPLRFLARTLRLWDPIGNAGQLQNQAYGYLFPMGPFFAALHALGVVPWEIQRAWESALVVAAFLGTYRLARRIGVDAFWPAVVAGLTYALAPRMLAELTSISAELMPVAALPWVLLPLVSASTRGSPRRAAARSGVALLFAGGVNAAATLAILPVPALWLLTRSRGPRRRALSGWWVVAVVLSCAWWALPLLQLGRYSPPFLDWIESSSTTTLPTSLLATLRGVDHWEAYLGPSIWPAGWVLASSRIAIVATTAVVAAGLVGLSRRDTPHRTFLWTTLLLGLVLVTAGHSATVGPPDAGAVRSLLDGALVPFRNVHKFDPLVRLPIALGVGYLLRRVRVPREVVVRRLQLRLPARVLATLAAVAIGLLAISPVLTNHLVSSQRVTAEPSWWAGTAKWLAAHAGGARALVVPGSASPQYLWGGSVDNALQPVATTPWTVRDSVPLAQAGYIRLLDVIESKLAAGAADPALAPLLARAGIGYVVLANDLNTLSSASTPLLYVRTTLNDSPGLSVAASIGPKVGGSLSLTALLDSGATVPQPAVQIYRVAGWAGVAALQPLTNAVEATGSSDALAQLVQRGLSPQTPVLFGADAAGVAATDPRRVTTDGIPKQEASFAGILTPSATMTADQPYSTQRPVHDYLPNDPGPLSVMTYGGIENVTASSSGADRLAYLNRSDLNGPWSALDQDSRSAWVSSSFGGAVGQWLQVDFAASVSAEFAELSFAAVPGALPASVLVRTDAGTVVDQVAPSTAAQSIRLPRGSTRHLRITVTAMADRSAGNSVAIATLAVPGVAPARSLQIPTGPSPDQFAFDAASGYRGTCLDVSRQAICDPHYARAGEEDAALVRSFTLTDSPAAEYEPAVGVRLVGGPGLDRLLDAGAPVQATATSTNSEDPRQRAGAAVDGDLTTSWQAAPGDATPQLTLSWPGRRTVSGVTLITPATSPVARPVRVTVTAGGQTWKGAMPSDGHIELPNPTLADQLTIRVDETGLQVSTDTAGLTTRLLAVGISEVHVDGGRDQPDAAGSVTIPCGAGPELDVDGTATEFSVTASREQALTGAVVPARPCNAAPIGLGTGTHRVGVQATAMTQPESITLDRVGAGAPDSAADATATMAVRSWGSTARTVRVDTTAAALLVVHENANPGWQATLGGHRLKAARVDGWEQAFVVPAGAHGTVRLTYAPQRQFVAGLIVGAVAAVAVLVLAFVRRGRGRDRHPPIDDARGPVLLAFGAAAVGFALLGAWAGALTLVVVSLGLLLVARTTARGWPWLGGGLLLVASFVVARGGTTQIFVRQNGGLAQLLCIAALAVGLASALGFPRQGRDP